MGKALQDAKDKVKNHAVVVDYRKTVRDKAVAAARKVYVRHGEPLVTATEVTHHDTLRLQEQLRRLLQQADQSNTLAGTTSSSLDPLI